MSFHDRKVQRVVEVDLVHRPEGESFDSLIPSTAELLEMGQADQQVLEKGNGFLEALDDVGSLGLGKFLASAGLGGFEEACKLRQDDDGRRWFLAISYPAYDAGGPRPMLLILEQVILEYVRVSTR